MKLLEIEMNSLGTVNEYEILEGRKYVHIKHLRYNNSSVKIPKNEYFSLREKQLASVIYQEMI